MAKIDPRKQLFAIGKAAGRSNKDLCEQIGITPKTAAIWNNDPIVQAKIGYRVKAKFQGMKNKV